MKKSFLLLGVLLLSSCSFFDYSSSQSSCSSISSSSESSISVSTSESSSSESSSSIIDSSSSIEDSSISTSESISDSSSVYDDGLVHFKTDRKDRDYTYFLDNSNDVYRINIRTNDDAFPGMDREYVNGFLSITSQDQLDYALKECKMKFKLRGNSTISAPKKPFKIKFSADKSLFGLEASDTWVLLANYYDKTCIRNYLAYLTANRLSGLDFQPSSIPVDVYINNEYYGLFLLCEQMEASKGRVDITGKKSKDGISSIMFEVDDRAIEEYPQYENICWFRTKYNGHSYMIRPTYPDVDDFIEEYYEKGKTDSTLSKTFINSFNYLRNFMNNLNVKLATLDHYEDYLDVDSFIDMYILQEVFKNVDYSSTSMYMYIDTSEENPKLRCGPAWDFDIGAGVVSDDSKLYQGYASATTYIKDRDFYYHYLFKDSSFVKKVKQRYTELRYNQLEGIRTEISNIKVDLKDAFTRNVNRWPLLVYNYTWIEENAYSARYASIAHTEGHFTYLKNWFYNRLSELDKEYLLDESSS